MEKRFPTIRKLLMRAFRLQSHEFKERQRLILNINKLPSNNTPRSTQFPTVPASMSSASPFRISYSSSSRVFADSSGGNDRDAVRTMSGAESAGPPSGRN